MCELSESLKLMDQSYLFDRIAESKFALLSNVDNWKIVNALSKLLEA